MEPNFKKIIKPNIQTLPIQVQPTKVVNLPTYDELSQSALTKNRYLSEFKTPEEKQRARLNLGIGNSFKVVGSFETVDELRLNVPVGNENEAYLIGDIIYTWSDDLNRWFKYSTLATVRKININYDPDIWTGGKLYNLFLNGYLDNLFTITYQGSTYDLDISKHPDLFCATFNEGTRKYIMTVTKMPNNTYPVKFNYIQYI